VLKKVNKYRVLWLEDDYMEALETAMQLSDYDVNHVFYVNDAYNLLTSNERYDLLLLDVMLPVRAADIKLGFTNEATKGATETGLLFYKKFQEIINRLKMRVVVYTINAVDELVCQGFHELGLPEEQILDKVDNANVNDLLSAIALVLRGKEPVCKLSQSKNIEAL
jgi:hypothetical protein